MAACVRAARMLSAAAPRMDVCVATVLHDACARVRLQALEDAGHAIDTSVFYTAGYDSPFRLRNRHNEVRCCARFDRCMPPLHATTAAEAACAPAAAARRCGSWRRTSRPAAPAARRRACRRREEGMLVSAACVHGGSCVCAVQSSC